MATTLLALGSYRFSVDTAAYQELTRTTEYRWPSQPRLGRRPARQFVGPGEDTIALRGVIYPHHQGGLGQLDDMRTEAEQGAPLQLVGGDGRVLGRWVVARIEETQPEHWSDGAPRRQDFVLELAYYGEDAEDGAAPAPVTAFPLVRPTTSVAGVDGALEAAQAPIRDLLGDADIPSAAEALQAADSAEQDTLRDLLGTANLTSAAQALRSVAAVARSPLQSLMGGGVDLAAATDALRAATPPLRDLLDVVDVAGASRVVQSGTPLPGASDAAADLASAAGALQGAVAPLRAIGVLSGLDPLVALGGLG